MTIIWDWEYHDHQSHGAKSPFQRHSPTRKTFQNSENRTFQSKRSENTKPKEIKKIRIGMEIGNLASDDGDGRQSVPESWQSAFLAVIAESRTSSLNLVHQRDQVLHFALRAMIDELSRVGSESRRLRQRGTRIRQCVWRREDWFVWNVREKKRGWRKNREKNDNLVREDYALVLRLL